VTVDPFTAAQQQERALEKQQSLLSQGKYKSPTVEEEAEADEDDELDGGIAFTQKLLSNAKTLRELQASGAPALEIAYEEPAHVQSQPAPAWSPGNFRTSLQRKRRPSQQARSQSQQQPVHAYQELTQAQFSSMNVLADDAFWQGRFESIPVRALQELTFQQAKQVLHLTRIYKPESSLPSFSTCLRDLFEGKALKELCVFHIQEQQGTNLLLRDSHDEPCTVLAHALYGGLEANPQTDAVKLSHFFFDHAVGFGPRKERQTETSQSSAELPAGQAQAQNMSVPAAPFPDADLTSTPLDVRTPTAVLMLVNAERVNYQAYKTQVEQAASQRQQNALMFEQSRGDSFAAAEVYQEEPPKATQDTDYGDVDLGDFPVEFVDE
jgi:hypothetical protein